jgi:hypothetical protein
MHHKRHTCEHQHEISAEAGRILHPCCTEQPAAGDGKQRPLVPRSRCLPRLSRSVDMTSAVKSREQLFLRLPPFFLEPLEETEPVMTTVDPADIRGLATTSLVSVRCLPRSRNEDFHL